MPQRGQPEPSLNLIPGLPDDLGRRILCMVPFAHRARIMATCKSWSTFLSSSSFIQSRFHFSSCDHLLCIFPEDPSISPPYLFDYRNLAWTLLPCMPCNPHAYGLSNFASVSIGSSIYVIGGSLFDTRSFPIDRPSPTSAGFKYCFLTSSWVPISPMICPRGSFACAAIPSLGQIYVAGGGSRHTLFSAAGSRMNFAERYDAAEDRWMEVASLPKSRAGCVGFAVGEREFWVMGGYGNWRTISGVFPVDEYYRDAVVNDMKRMSGGEQGQWREIGDMWPEGERPRLGKVVVLEDDDASLGSIPTVFMLDNSNIFRYEMKSNQWRKETSVPRKARGCCSSSYGFAEVGGELHVMSKRSGADSTEGQRTRQGRRNGMLLIQIYNPQKKKWRSLMCRSPLPTSFEFRSAVMCTIRL